MADHVYRWDAMRWNSSRWACYSAFWDNMRWDSSLWDYTFTADFFNALDSLKKINIGTYVWEPDVAEPGMDNDGVPLRKILANLEKK